MLPHADTERSAVCQPVALLCSRRRPLRHQCAGGLGYHHRLVERRRGGSSTPASPTMPISPAAPCRGMTSSRMLPRQMTGTAATAIPAIRAIGSLPPRAVRILCRLFGDEQLLARHPHRRHHRGRQQQRRWAWQASTGVPRSCRCVCLGKCGGTISDIVDGMRWSAGLAVAGVPANANPAKVLNLSLGGCGACGTTYQDAINAIVAAGTTVVIAAGNSNADASGSRPANCNGVITVAATNRNGSRASYSNYGAVVEISAPAEKLALRAMGFFPP